VIEIVVAPSNGDNLERWLANVFKGLSPSESAMGRGHLWCFCRGSRAMVGQSRGCSIRL